ncbi:phage late control D family protein [Foetidibacter luteolus]|uniref:phage late control D family protein n=1 Tax=Foetidibacter luteolus TaxID=2608880 RepID=UPI00129B7B1B|nr:contractile injection system protein, VgrG/Pvc8 family [Foetidibacter luteolus]
MQVPKTTYEVLYNGKNITGDILPYVLSINYTDRATGEADELEIVLEDSAKLWQLDYYPTHGDTVSVQFFDLGRTLNCGAFTIDEVTASFSLDGDIVTIKALAAGIHKDLRTVKFYAHEKKTLREIANTIASRHGLTVEGNIPDVRIERKTQYQKTDLHFLQELAHDYGYTFSVRENKLTFTNMLELESKETSLIINRNEVTRVEVTDKTAQTYRTADIKYHHPRKKSTIVFTKPENETAFKSAKADTLVMRKRIENKQQAEIMATVALYRANSLKQEGTVEMPGNVFVLAGNSVQLTGFGMASGKYYITESTHSVSRDGGYASAAQIKRVGLISKNDY